MEEFKGTSLLHPFVAKQGEDSTRHELRMVRVPREHPASQTLGLHPLKPIGSAALPPRLQHQ